MHERICLFHLKPTTEMLAGFPMEFERKKRRAVVETLLPRGEYLLRRSHSWSSFLQSCLAVVFFTRKYQTAFIFLVSWKTQVLKKSACIPSAVEGGCPVLLSRGLCARWLLALEDRAALGLAQLGALPGAWSALVCWMSHPASPVCCLGTVVPFTFSPLARTKLLCARRRTGIGVALQFSVTLRFWIER